MVYINIHEKHHPISKQSGAVEVPSFKFRKQLWQYNLSINGYFWSYLIYSSSSPALLAAWYLSRKFLCSKNVNDIFAANFRAMLTKSSLLGTTQSNYVHETEAIMTSFLPYLVRFTQINPIVTQM